MSLLYSYDIPIIMDLLTADDLLTANTGNLGLQEQFDIIERTSEEDGLRISYPKTELTVFRSQRPQENNKWVLHGNRGNIFETGRNWAKYLGFHVEADGYQKQWEVNAERVEVAGGSLIQLFLEHPMMTNEMRTTLYSTKVRSLALLGADIWGWRRAYRLDKSDAKSLRILTRAHTRTKLEAMLWLVGLYPIWVLAAVQAFKFLISILEHGDVMEKTAWEQWKQCCRLHDNGWAFDMVSFFKRIDLLDQMGGRDNVLNWTAPQARHWFPIFRERCNNIAEQDMLRTLRSGKYSFLVHAIPTFESPRPTALSLGLLCGRSLNNFLLSSHLLEVETGRYIRQQREQRFCQACKRSLGLRVLGDEQHALSSCVRAAEQRQLSFAKILSLFPGDSLRHIQHNSLFNMLNSLNILSTNQQNLAWKLVAKYTLAVQQSIRSELGTQDRIPNIWKECMKNILLKSVTKAAEKYFRKRLRRQQRNMPALPAIVISDDSDDDVEILN